MINFKKYVNEAKESPIIKAAKDNDYDNVRMYLGDGEKANASTSAGKTPMMFAALNGNVKMGQLLKEEGGSINSSDNKGITVLMTAVKAGKTEFVEWLINEKVSLDDKCSDKFMPTALAAAIYNKKGPIIELLVNAGASIRTSINGNDNLLNSAMNYGNSLKTIKFLMDKGVSSYNMVDSFYRDPKFKHLAYEEFEKGNCSSSVAYEFIEHKLGWWYGDIKDPYFTNKTLSQAIKTYRLDSDKNLYKLLTDTEFFEAASLIAPNIKFNDDEIAKIIDNYSNNVSRLKTLNIDIPNVLKVKKQLCDASLHGFEDMANYLMDNGVTLDGIDNDMLSTICSTRFTSDRTMRRVAELIIRAGLEDKALAIAKRGMGYTNSFENYLI